MNVAPFFLDTDSGRLFVICFRPAGPIRGVIVHAHAFAEEMNKARRAATLAARRLAAAGWLVVQPDLYGCGDSGGDFGDASWACWINNLSRAVGWAREQYVAHNNAQHGAQIPLWLWGTRSGALLTAAVAAQVQPMGFLWWQPVVSGRQYLTQFLRLKIAGELISGDGSAADTKTLRAQLNAGERLEIAGYTLSPGLAQGLETAELKTDVAAEIIWLEVNAREEPMLSPASRVRIDALRMQGASVHAQALSGDPFWQSVEIAEVPQLIDATYSAMQRY